MRLFLSCFCKSRWVWSLNPQKTILAHSLVLAPNNYISTRSYGVQYFLLAPTWGLGRATRQPAHPQVGRWHYNEKSELCGHLRVAGVQLAVRGGQTRLKDRPPKNYISWRCACNQHFRTTDSRRPIFVPEPPDSLNPNHGWALSQPRVATRFGFAI